MRFRWFLWFLLAVSPAFAQVQSAAKYRYVTIAGDLTCAAGQYFTYADSVAGAVKTCENGVIKTATAPTPAFSAIGSGTNTTAAMIVGTGASLAPTSGTAGTVTANRVPSATVVTCASGNAGRLGVQAAAGPMFFCDGANTFRRTAYGDASGNATGVSCTSCVDGADLSTTQSGAITWSGVQTFNGSQKFNADSDVTPNIDYIRCGDMDASATLTEADIELCMLAACPGTRPGTVELLPGTWTLDVNHSGQGETAGCELSDPHVCVRSNCTLKGAGPGATVLQMATGHNGAGEGASGYGKSPYIGTDSDGTATTDPTDRPHDIAIEDLTVTGQSTTSAGASDGSVSAGIYLAHCDRCRVHNVETKIAAHAGVLVLSSSDVTISDVQMDRVGNYDTDGATVTDTPTTSQGCLEFWGVLGYDQARVNVSNVTIHRCGGIGIDIKGSSGVVRPTPWGETDLIVDDATSTEYVAQTFTQSLGTVARPSALWLRLRAPTPTSAPSGTMTVQLETTSGGVATGTAVTGYAYTDWETVAAASLTPNYRWYRFGRLSAAPTALTNGAVYALVLKYDTPGGPVGLESDAASDDTYTGGALYTGASDPPTTSAGTGYDANFAIDWASNTAFDVNGVIVDDVSGINGVRTNCISLAVTRDSVISNVTCNLTGGSIIGDSNSPLVSNVALSGIATSSTLATNASAYQFGASNDNVTLTGISAKDSTLDGIFIKEWARDVHVSGGSVAGAYNGIEISKGARNITFDNVNVTNATATGLVLGRGAGDEDGVYHGTKHVAFRNGAILGVTGRCIDGVSGSTSFQDVTITGNQIGHCRDSAIRIKTSDWTPDSSGLLISHNYFHEWGDGRTSADNPGTTTGILMYENGTTSDLRGAIVSDNTFSTSKSSVDSPFAAHMAGLDNLSVTGNVAVGTFVAGLSGSLWSVTRSTSTQHFNVAGNLPNETAAPSSCSPGETFADADGDGGGLYLAVCGPADTWTYK